MTALPGYIQHTTAAFCAFVLLDTVLPDLYLQIYISALLVISKLGMSVCSC